MLGFATSGGLGATEEQAGPEGTRHQVHKAAGSEVPRLRWGPLTPYILGSASRDAVPLGPPFGGLTHTALFRTHDVLRTEPKVHSEGAEGRAQRARRGDGARSASAPGR